MKNKNLKLFLLILNIFFVYKANAEIVYPIQEMSKVDCRFQDFSTLGDECKMQLPVLKTSDYEKYKNDYSLYRRVYTVLWGSSYDYGWDVGNGGHQGVDIATAKGTPVYSIMDGKVVLAKNIAGRGNAIKIEHTINGKKIYSNYAHLSKIDVSVGDNIKAKTKIGEVGSTGNSYGNHLHFQIDVSVSGSGPRYRSNCAEKNYDKIVNSNVCFSQLNNNTIDPLLFLETSGAVVKQSEINKPKQEIISKEGLLSREEILRREIQEFLKNYEIKVNVLNIGGNIELGKTGTFRLNVTDKRTKKPFTGSFPGSLNFKFDGNKFSIFPTGILQIDNGKRDFQVTPKLSGKMNLDIYIGETFFKKVTFGVFDTKKSIKPSSMIINLGKNSSIGENSKSILYFKDNYGLNILGFKFDGNFSLKSDDKSVKFCIKKANSLSDLNYTYNSKCSENNFKFEQNFSYKDTLMGILIFEYKPLNLGSNSINIYSGNNSFSNFKVSAKIPNGLDVNYVYFDSVLNTSKLGIATGINGGYFLQDRDLSTEDGVNFIKNLLEYKLSKCSDTQCKNNYLDKIYQIGKIQTDKYTYYTRGEFLALIGEYFPLNDYNKDDFITFRDLNNDLQKYSKNILKNKTWEDYFGKTRYFQPDKKITRGEGAFLINQILN